MVTISTQNSSFGGVVSGSSTSVDLSQLKHSTCCGVVQQSYNRNEILKGENSPDQQEAYFGENVREARSVLKEIFKA